MAFLQYFVELIKQDGPNQQTKVVVPIDGNSLPVDTTDGKLKPSISTTTVVDASVTTAKIADASVTPAKTNIVQAVTGTDTGATTGTILDTTTHATVTSSASSKQVILPAPTPGRMLVISVGANGFDLKSSAPASVAINGGVGASAKSAIAANSTILAICISATAWKAIFLDADSDVAKVAAAA